MVEPNVGANRKKPPSFPHVHPSLGIVFLTCSFIYVYQIIWLAKKFKKAWVEKVKIKSQWKAQKRKERLMEKSKLDIPNYDEKTDAEEYEPQSTSAVAQGTPTRERDDKTQTHRSYGKPEGDDSRELAEIKKSRVYDEKSGSGDNIRELMKEAYSKSNLHTFKSDPLKRHATAGRTKGGKGKGQPNMKLRMNAMLAKIKRDYA